MTRLALLSSLVVAIAVTAPSLAEAGGYVAAGLGTAAGPGSSSGSFGSDERLSGRVMLGQRVRFVSVEAGLAGYGLEGLTPGTRYDAVALGAGLKLNLPLFLGFEVFGRAGVERTWLDAGAAMPSYRGNGYVVGAGLEYRLDLVVTEGSLWADWTRHDADLHSADDAVARDASVDLWTAGVALDL